ncbi:hypothetical protein [Stappia indica]|uniref:hypothetical protein n=1 Tax=Stappia indica TaxID=538381 RepID=UPI001CD6BDF3|nr:hypothetical protein [Stappia indica]MCA1296961.1 hypothetical protein [Stappia indica]
MRPFLVLLLSAVLLLGHALPAAGPMAASEVAAGLLAQAANMEQGTSGEHQGMDTAATMGCCALADLAGDTAAGHCLADCLFILPLSVLNLEHGPARDISLVLRKGTAFAPPLTLRPPIS